jgi:LPS-assembly lipoprotein
MNESRRKIALTPFLLLLIAGCGFRLRGTADVPFETLYVPDSHSGIGLDLKRHIEAGTNTRVVSDPKQAQAILQLANERRGREILTISGAGRVSEFQLRYQISIRVHDGKGGEYLPLSTIMLSREMTFQDPQILAKEAEEQLLFRDMQAEAVQQILRRLSGAQKPKPKVD